MRAFRIALRHHFRGLDEREGLLIRGPSGWGEFSPFSDYRLGMRARWLSCAHEAAYGSWPPAVRDRVPVNVTVPAVPPNEAARIVATSGCLTAKVKVGDDHDEARLETVRDALGPHGRIRIDVNGAWEVDEAVRRIRRLARYELEYVEQPVATLEEMASLRRLIDVPLAADESIREAEDPRRVNLSEAADVAVLKVSPLGGIRAALEVADAVGVPVVVSSALETSVGIAAGMALAAALPELPYACGLATAALLEGDVVSESLLPIAGEIEVRRPAVDDDAIARFEIPAEPWVRLVQETSR